MDTEVARENINIPQGSTKVVRFITRGLTGALYDPLGFRMQIRSTVGGTILDEWVTPDADVELSTNAGGYVLLTIPDTTTQGYAPGEYVYDAEVEEPLTGLWFRVAQGNVCVDANVTV